MDEGSQHWYQYTAEYRWSLTQIVSGYMQAVQLNAVEWIYNVLAWPAWTPAIFRHWLRPDRRTGHRVGQRLAITGPAGIHVVSVDASNRVGEKEEQPPQS